MTDDIDSGDHRVLWLGSKPGLFAEFPGRFWLRRFLDQPLKRSVDELVFFSSNYPTRINAVPANHAGSLLCTSSSSVYWSYAQPEQLQATYGREILRSK